MSETDRLLGHEYDGIQEFDNPTPGWWHMIFIGSIVFSVFYVLVFMVSPLPFGMHERYDADLAAFYQKKFAKFGVLEPNEETIVGLMKNEAYMAVVAGTYKGKCATCHGKNGEGLVGPNMSDDRYINVKTVLDIHDVISNGRALKGMPSWGRQLDPNEVVLLSAYIASIRGTNVPTTKTPMPGEDLVDPWPDHPMLDFDEPDAAQ